MRKCAIYAEKVWGSMLNAEKVLDSVLNAKKILRKCAKLTTAEPLSKTRPF